MIDFTLETHLDRSAGEVFDYITDPAQLPNWQTNTISSVPRRPDGRRHPAARGPPGTLDPVESGTRMRFRAYGRLTGAARVFSPLLALVLRRQFTTQLATLRGVFTG